MKKKDWYKVEIRELIRKNLGKIHRKVGDSYGIDVSFLHKMISDYATQELSKAREEWTEELRQAFYDTFYKSGELWFDYIFEDGDTKAEQNAKEVVEEYWKEIISKLATK